MRGNDVLLSSAVGYLEPIFAGHTSYAVAMAATVTAMANAATALRTQRRSLVFGESTGYFLPAAANP